MKKNINLLKRDRIYNDMLTDYGKSKEEAYKRLFGANFQSLQKYALFKVYVYLLFISMFPVENILIYSVVLNQLSQQ